MADGLGELVVEVWLLDVGVDEVADGGDDDELVGACEVGADVGLGLAGPVGSGDRPLVSARGPFGDWDVAGAVFAGSGLSSGSGR